MNHEYRNLAFIIAFIVCIGCSPTYRYNRLLEKYPYLQDTIRKTEVIIRDSVHQDTQVVWKNSIDTIVLNQVKIERRNDTFRIITRERPCTTYVNKTIVKPSKTVEKYIEEKAEKGAIYEIKKYLWIIIIGLLIVLLIRR